MAVSVFYLTKIERSPDLPDSLGAATHSVGEECYRALNDNDESRFKKLFGAYFIGILENAERVRPQVIGWEPNSALTWYTEPTIDLMDISGYSYIFAELHGNPALWKACTDIWDTYFGEGDDAIQTYGTLLANY